MNRRRLEGSDGGWKAKGREWRSRFLFDQPSTREPVYRLLIPTSPEAIKQSQSWKKVSFFVRLRRNKIEEIPIPTIHINKKYTPSSTSESSDVSMHPFAYEQVFLEYKPREKRAFVTPASPPPPPPIRLFYSCLFNDLALKWQRGWRWLWDLTAYCCVNKVVPLLTSCHYNEIGREVCIKTGSPPTSLEFIGQATKHTTVKWPIPNYQNMSTNLFKFWDYFP